MTSFAPLARALSERAVRYLLIGISGANLHAHRAGVVFTTHDRDLFLPADPQNLLTAWRACEACDLNLTSSGAPLDRPRDLTLAERRDKDRLFLATHAEALRELLQPETEE